MLTTRRIIFGAVVICITGAILAISQKQALGNLISGSGNDTGAELFITLTKAKPPMSQAELDAICNSDPNRPDASKKYRFVGETQGGADTDSPHITVGFFPRFDKYSISLRLPDQTVKTIPRSNTGVGLGLYARSTFVSKENLDIEKNYHPYASQIVFGNIGKVVAPGGSDYLPSAVEEAPIVCGLYEQNPFSCHSDDQNDDYAKKGTRVTKDDPSFYASDSSSDHCINSYTLVEEDCDDKNYAYDHEYVCPYGCNNGACIAQEISLNADSADLFLTKTQVTAPVSNTYLDELCNSDQNKPDSGKKYRFVGRNYSDKKVIYKYYNSFDFDYAPVFSGEKVFVRYPDGTTEMLAAGQDAMLNTVFFKYFGDGEDFADSFSKTLSFSRIGKIAPGSEISVKPERASVLCAVVNKNKNICRDLEGVKDYFSQGTVSIQETAPGYGTFFNTKTDYCLNGTLVETLCDENGYPAFEEVKCAYGCAEGACSTSLASSTDAAISSSSPTAVKCNDSDKGLNVYIKGVVNFKINGKPENKYDICAEDGRIRELACDASGQPVESLLPCPEGKICREGACKNEEKPNQNNSGSYSTAYFMCYDGSEFNEGSASACKSSEDWISLGEKLCEKHCYSDFSKCGINTYRAGEKCGPDESIKKMEEQARLLAENKIEAILEGIKEERSLSKEQDAAVKYLDKMPARSAISSSMQTALKLFIAYGADANTKDLGEGERAAVVSSYQAAFDRLPQNDKDLAELIKAANGRYPNATSSQAEYRARNRFIKIYKRIPDSDSAKDQAAITVMAYGLRQKARNRSVKSEGQALAAYEQIFGNTPDTTEEWNALQAITYSGAVRMPDSDNDLLPDDMEDRYGSDKNDPDSDKDGYKDGLEVVNGYDPGGKGRLK